MNRALETTANVLTITSSLLAIGIELGILGGGYYLYKKYLAEPKTKTVDSTVRVLASEDDTDIIEPKNTPREKFRKVGSIIRAVLE